MELNPPPPLQLPSQKKKKLQEHHRLCFGKLSSASHCRFISPWKPAYAHWHSECLPNVSFSARLHHFLVRRSDFLSSSGCQRLCKQVKPRKPNPVRYDPPASVGLRRVEEAEEEQTHLRPPPCTAHPPSLFLIPSLSPSSVLHLSGCRVGGCVGAGAGVTWSGLRECRECEGGEKKRARHFVPVM